jgi:hypothetical protein
MANSLTANFAEYWSKRLQLVHDKQAIYKNFVNWEAHKALKNGDKFHLPYGHNLKAVAYSRTAAFTAQDISTTDEELTVDKQYVVPFYIDSFDEIQESIKSRNYWIDRAATALTNQMDGDVLAEVANAGDDLDYYDIDSSKTVGDGIPLNTTTLPKIFSNANKKLDRQNVPENERAFIGDPDFYQVLLEYLAGRETALGDRVGVNGYKGKFYGVEIYISNASYATGKLNMATNPTAGDTLVINGVTITFQETLGTAAGNVHICTNTEKTIKNLVTFLNTPGTSIAEANDTGAVALSAANQAKLNNITFTEAATSMTFVSKGNGYIPLAETLTDVTDAWDDGLNIVHYMFARKGIIHMAIQKYPSVQIKDISDRLGVNIVSSCLYGIKTFKEGKDQMIDIKINTLARI